MLPLRRKHWLIDTFAAVIVALCLAGTLSQASSLDNVSEATLFPLAAGLVCVIYVILSIFSTQQRVPGVSLIVIGIALMAARIFVAAVADLALVDPSVYAANSVIPVIQVIDGFVFAALPVGNALRLLASRSR